MFLLWEVFVDAVLFTLAIRNKTVFRLGMCLGNCGVMNLSAAMGTRSRHRPCNQKFQAAGHSWTFGDLARRRKRGRPASMAGLSRGGVGLFFTHNQPVNDEFLPTAFRLQPAESGPLVETGRHLGDAEPGEPSFPPSFSLCAVLIYTTFLLWSAGDDLNTSFACPVLCLGKQDPDRKLLPGPLCSGLWWFPDAEVLCPFLCDLRAPRNCVTRETQSWGPPALGVLKEPLGFRRRLCSKQRLERPTKGPDSDREWGDLAGTHHPDPGCGWWYLCLGT